MYATHEERLTFSYSKQAQTLGVHWPSSQDRAPSREQAIAELAEVLAVIARLGELPRKMSKAARSAAQLDIEQALPALLAAAKE